MRGRLTGTTVYLAGAMDRVADGGVGWRQDITVFLCGLGIRALDPSNKPIDLACENPKTRAKRRRLKANGEFDKLIREMRETRAVDLRMVQRSDFLIVHIDLDVHACGTYEEVFLANNLGMPVLTVIEQGRSSCPDWLFACLPIEHIFGSWRELTRYLCKVNSSRVKHPRFILFNSSSPAKKLPSSRKAA